MANFRFCSFSILTLISLITLANSMALAQTASYSFASQLGTQTNTPVTSTALSVSATDITRGPGITANAGANSMNSTGFNTSPNTLAAAITSGDFYTFSVTNGTAAPIDLVNLTLGLQRSGTGPATAELQVSLDGFATAGTVVGSDFAIVTSATFAANSLTSVPDLAVGQTIAFRIYAYGSTGGTFRLTDVFGAAGVVLNPVPEPGIVLAFAAGALGVGGYVRRRKWAI